ncbi:hypothetical protein ASE69_11095 [Sphingomonas sp. Leaf208]|uniref:hypothetical protein n=1 Tax=Sphingomonas sp. Leaf208 TaxID=1735679 RepID=UPI0006F9F247|nr:hypothetical protein [Sphingomonas sp. Leaf208]KQM49311.1 hypothetical protein ASE69_11095 [Sphingomonas sp. Leaf208]
MNTTLKLLTALVILAIAQTLTTALGIVLLMLALMAAITHPRETLGFAFCSGMLMLALNAPAVCAAALGAIGVTVAIINRVKPPRETPLPLPYMVTLGDRT